MSAAPNNETMTPPGIPMPPPSAPPPPTASGLDKTRLIYQRAVLLKACGYSEAEISELDLMCMTDFETAVHARASERKTEERSAEQDILMEPIELVFVSGEERRVYEVHPKKIFEEKKWRAAMGQITRIASASAPIQIALNHTVSGALKGASKEEIMASVLENVNPGELALDALPLVIEFGFEQMLEVMFSYSKQMADDREWIESNISMDERQRAACQMMRLAFPMLVRMLAGMLDLIKIDAKSSKAN